MKREMEVEVRKIDRGLGNVYDEQLGGEAPKDPMAAAQKLLGGLDDPNGPQMIRPGDASVAAPFTSRAALSLEGARSSERQMMASGWRAGRVPRDADPRAPPRAHGAVRAQVARRRVARLLVRDAPRVDAPDPAARVPVPPVDLRRPARKSTRERERERGPRGGTGA